MTWLLDWAHNQRKPLHPTILVKNLETLVCVSPSPMLIWVLQVSQCSKIGIAQHWGRRGAHLSEGKVWRVNVRNFQKINSRETVSVSMICDEYCSYVPPLDRQLANLLFLPRAVAPFSKFKINMRMTCMGLRPLDNALPHKRIYLSQMTRQDQTEPYQLHICYYT